MLGSGATTAVTTIIEPPPAKTITAGAYSSEILPEHPSEALSATAAGGIPVAGIPQFDDPYRKRQWRLEHMAGAFRNFARKNFTEGTAGHISVRDPVEPSTFWINP